MRRAEWHGGVGSRDDHGDRGTPPRARRSRVLGGCLALCLAACGAGRRRDPLPPATTLARIDAPGSLVLEVRAEPYHPSGRLGWLADLLRALPGHPSMNVSLRSAPAGSLWPRDGFPLWQTTSRPASMALDVAPRDVVHCASPSRDRIVIGIVERTSPSDAGAAVVRWSTFYAHGGRAAVAGERFHGRCEEHLAAMPPLADWLAAQATRRCEMALFLRVSGPLAEGCSRDAAGDSDR